MGGIGKMPHKTDGTYFCENSFPVTPMERATHKTQVNRRQIKQKHTQDISRQTKLKETSLLLEHFKRHQDTDYTYTDKSSCRTLHWTPGEPGKLPFGVFQGTPGDRQHRNRQAFNWSSFWEHFMGHEQTDYIDIQTSLAKAITLRVPEENLHKD